MGGGGTMLVHNISYMWVPFPVGPTPSRTLRDWDLQGIGPNGTRTQGLEIYLD
jgi:hypothetical protein